jgi:drug/metabolite transporter superfamily protein YnfA
MREKATVWPLLIGAALLELSGSAGVRLGLRGRPWGFLVGPLALVAYGFVVNGSRWDFGRLMGAYIAIFYLAAQLQAVTLFREPPSPPILLGSALIITGGLVLTFWHPSARR